MRSSALDALQASFEQLIFRRSEEDMDMVSHNDNGMKCEPLRVISADSFQGNLRDFLPAEEWKAVVRGGRQEIGVVNLVLRVHAGKLTSRR